MSRDHTGAAVHNARFDVTNVVVSDCSSPNWQRLDIKMDDSCTRLGDDCTTVRCQFLNLSSESQTGTLTGTYTSGGLVTRIQQVQLGPNQTAWFKFDFPESQLFDSDARGDCFVAPEHISYCAEIECQVSNTGDASGTATVELGFGWLPTKEAKVDLAPGQTRGVSRKFELEGEPGPRAGGTCTWKTL